MNRKVIISLLLCIPLTIIVGYLVGCAVPSITVSPRVPSGTVNTICLPDYNGLAPSIAAYQSTVYILYPTNTPGYGAPSRFRYISFSAIKYQNEQPLDLVNCQ